MGIVFQAKFHWHVEDKGMRHAYSKGTPQLDGKVERSHRYEIRKVVPLLSYKDDIDLEQSSRSRNVSTTSIAHTAPSTKNTLRSTPRKAMIQR